MHGKAAFDHGGDVDLGSRESGYLPAHLFHCRLFANREHVVRIPSFMTSCRTAVLWIAVVLSTIAVQASALAAELERDIDIDATEVHLETVERTGQDYEDPRFASGFVSRLMVGHLFARGQNLGQALSLIAGLYVLQQSSFGQSAFVSLRGGTPRQLVVLFDGMRISVPAGLGFDVGQLSLAGMRSVDVYRGSAGMVFGAGALTGAISLNPAPPPEPGWQWSATTMGGSFGTRGASATLGRSTQELGLSLNASYRQSEGDFGFIDEQGTTHRRLNNDHRRLSLLGSSRWKVGDHQLRASVLFEDGEAGTPGPSEFQEALSLARTEDQRLVASTHWRVTDALELPLGAVDTEVGAGYQQRTFFYHNPDGFMTRSAFENEAVHRALLLNGQAASYLEVGNITHLRVEGRQEWYDASSRSLEQRAMSVTRQTLSASLANELLLFSESVSLLTSLRAETIADARFVARPVLPAAGLIWRLAPSAALKANAARTFRAPDFDELYLDTESVRGNPHLSPERAWTLDAGLNVADPRGTEGVWAAGAVVFENRIDAMILFLPTSAYVFEAINLDGALSRGVELTALFRPFARHQLNGSYTLTRAHLRGEEASQAQLPHQPLHRGLLRFTSDLSGLGFWKGLHHLGLHGTANYRSPIHLDHFQSLRNPAALFLDAGTTLSPTQRWSIDLNVQNLLDHRRAEDTLQRPLAGRAVFVGLTLGSPP